MMRGYMQCPPQGRREMQGSFLCWREELEDSRWACGWKQIEARKRDWHQGQKKKEEKDR